MQKHRAVSDPDILAQLSPAERRKLDQRTVVREHPKGALINSPGNIDRYVYYVMEGRVKIYDLSACGREIVFRTCGPKSFFGIAEIFGRYERQVFAEAIRPTKVLCIEKPAFELLIKANPAVALLVIRVLGHRIRQAHRSIKSFVFCDTRSRLAQLLLKLAEMDGELHADGAVTIKPQLTHQEIADMIGAIRQTASEILNDLKKLGHIKTERSRITILNRAGLEGLIHD
jgi:CRP/FNR family transcriptional regulator, cyclic AMP receptor protein